MSDLAAIRRNLAVARAELRQCDDAYHAARLRAELALIEKVGNDPKNVGSNDSDRKRAYDIAVEGDADCHLARLNLRAAQVAVARLEAELEIQLDMRRSLEWSIREREVNAIEFLERPGINVQLPPAVTA